MDAKRGGTPPGTPAATETAPGAPATAESRRGRLVIDTNAACVLRIGGVVQEQVLLLPDAPRTVAVGAGEVAIECASTTVPEARIEVARMVEAGGEQSVALDVADLVVKASCAGKPATLADLGHGVLRHCVTGVDWTQADNGADADRESAGAWCTKKGGAWELPTANALAELIDRSGRSSTPCGKETCYVSPHFRLTAPTYWSKDPVGPATAMLVHLLLGGRHPALLHISRGYRALCIRRP
ncbi:MAG: hypothetical protein IPM02_13475 [Betaproteobacteria bacterium]|nr:hypothetical protein [Betaproteobacteria bacterium]